MGYRLFRSDKEEGGTTEWQTKMEKKLSDLEEKLSQKPEGTSSQQPQAIPQPQPPVKDEPEEPESTESTSSSQEKEKSPVQKLLDWLL